MTVDSLNRILDRSIAEGRTRVRCAWCSQPVTVTTVRLADGRQLRLWATDDDVLECHAVQAIAGAVALHSPTPPSA